MKKNIIERAQAYLGNSALGRAYDATVGMARESGLLGGLQDAYRRIFENGFWGKDIFDGRWHWDNKAARGEGDDTRPQLGGGYDQRAAFYGWDKTQQQGQDQDRAQDRRGELQRDRGDELGL